ncbi:MAG: tRNA threonylcarbamoyladenosine dehydratase [Lachnospiraceae bacterium]|jgi:tRNA A37 threonylcarbamoyladenosine dehydratase|nr:tRNA threonylcarbamoyladenosine dehydratase [Lachnospiraceae bacterium]
MLNQFSRAALVYGQEAMEVLSSKRVAVFGIGGVGGNVVEALARSGIGALDLIDDDRICLTNLNRQVMAVLSTVGQYKVDVAKARVCDINPKAEVRTYRLFYLPETAALLDFTQFDYVVDAVDTVTAKIDIILQARKCGVPVISCMGCGNRTDPSRLCVTDIYQTKQDPLARVMRYELRKRGVESLKVVYSTEPAIRPVTDADNSCAHHCICPPGTARKCTERRDIPGSTAFVPPAAGLLAASVIVRELTCFDPSPRIKGSRAYTEAKQLRKAASGDTAGL